MAERRARRERLRLASLRWLRRGPSRLALGAVIASGALLVPTARVSAITAPPPAACNGSSGVLATPQNVDGSGNALLTKVLTSTVQGTGSTTYFFQLTTARPSGSTFSELLDCAFSVPSGSPTVATYGTQQNNPTFSGGQLTISLTVNQNDSICDRVQLIGTDPSNNSFTDYSNLVGSPSGTSCLSAITPEAPVTALLLIAGGGVLAITGLSGRRRRRPLRV